MTTLKNIEEDLENLLAINLYGEWRDCKNYHVFKLSIYRALEVYRKNLKNTEKQKSIIWFGKAVED